MSVGIISYTKRSCWFFWQTFCLHCSFHFKTECNAAGRVGLTV